MERERNMKPWVESTHCASRVHCRACRTSPADYRAPELCPFGFTLNNLPKRPMKTIRDTSTVPTEGWQYPAISGPPIYTRNYSLLYGLVVEHYRSNGAEPPSEQAVIDWQCDNLFLPCYESNTREPLINRFTQGLPPPAKGCCGK